MIDDPRDGYLYLLCLSTRDSPLGHYRPTAAGRDDDVAFARNSRQGYDTVESEESHAHTVQVTT